MATKSFLDLSPTLYHVTARANLTCLAITGEIRSAAQLASSARRPNVTTGRRHSREPLRTPDGTITLHDPKPLKVGNIAFEGGWDEDRLLGELNRRVFLWPGRKDGPIGYATRHFEVYSETDVVLRIPTKDLPMKRAEFCRYNSGSPRYSRGLPSPRGPETFVPTSDWQLVPSRVVEVTFVGSLRLPESTEWADHFGGPWWPLFAHDECS